MDAHAGKHFPRPTPVSRPYWDACREGRLLLQRCDSCGKHQFYPRILCSHCGGSTLAWAEASGRGTVQTFTVVRRPVSPGYAADTPYVIALIALAEGPVMMSNVVGCAPEDVGVGMPVEVLFETWSEEITVPKFRPVTAGA